MSKLTAHVKSFQCGILKQTGSPTSTSSTNWFNKFSSCSQHDASILTYDTYQNLRK